MTIRNKRERELKTASLGDQDDGEYGRIETNFQSLPFPPKCESGIDRKEGSTMQWEDPQVLSVPRFKSWPCHLRMGSPRQVMSLCLPFTKCKLGIKPAHTS